MKLVPLSLMMREGQPCLDTNLLSAAIKASVVSSDTASKCKAFTAKEMKRQMQAFTTVGFLV